MTIEKIKEPPSQPSQDFMGAPSVAMRIIFYNVIFAGLLLGGLYVLAGGRLTTLPLLVVVIIGGAGFGIALQFLFWKLYWWLVALQWSCFTFLLVIVVVGILFGAVTIPSNLRF